MGLLEIFSKTDLGPPATALINRVADAIGAVAGPALKPWQARAEVEAEKIRTLGRIEIEDAEEEALSSFARQWRKERQRQIEVLGPAVKLLEPGADPDAIDEDWLLLLLDRARLVSDEEMQSLWSRILAGEANQPGSFSKRSLAFVSTLEKHEANLFTSLCRFVLHDSRGSYPCVRLGDRKLQPLYSEHQITTGTISHLQDIGLIHDGLTSGTARFIQKEEWASGIQLRYFEEQRTFRSQHVETESENFASHWMDAGFFGTVSFTVTGRQLSRIAGAEPVPQFLDRLEMSWAEMDIERGRRLLQESKEG